MVSTFCEARPDQSLALHCAALCARARLWILWLCCAMLPGLAHAAADAPPAADRWSALGEPVFKSYTDRVVANTVSFAQDKDGFVWMGTKTGLVRWDGYQFKRYVADATTVGALPDSYLLCLHTDPLGRLWIGTGAGGLARYDAAQDKFVTEFVTPGAAQAGQAKGTVAALADDGKGGLWIGTGKGLDHLDADGKVTSVPIPAQLTGATGSSGVNALQRDDDGTLWIGTRLGVWRRAAGSASFVPLALPVRTGVAAATRLYRDSGGRTWIGTAMHGAFTVAPGADAGVPVPESGPAPMLAQQRVTSIVEAEPGQVWLGTEGGGVLMVDVRTGVTRRARHRIDAPGSLAEDDAVALFRERSGLILVAGMRVLSQHDPRQRAVLSLLMEKGGTSIKAVAAMPDGRVWMGVNSGGIMVLDPASGAVTPLVSTGRDAAADALAGSRVLAMARGPDDKVWIGTRRGLFRSSVDGQDVERITIPGRDAAAQVWVMAFIGPTLWMGGPDGLWALDPGTQGMPRVLRRETTSLGDTRVTAIARGAGSALWVGTRTGLVRLDLATGATTAMSTGAGNPHLLPSGYVSSLLLDRRGRLWVTVYGIGIGLLESGDVAGRHRFRRIGIKEGLPDVGVNKLLEDGAGRLWVSTDDGLASIDPVTLAVRTLQQSQGVHVLEHWTNSGDITSTGELLFGGQAGLTVVRPNMYKDVPLRAPLVVSEIRVGEKSLPVGPFNAAAGAAAPVILAGQGNVWVEFSSLDFAAAESNRYSYRLQGYDADWIRADAGYRRANYDKLPPGDYQLLLRGSNRDGAWSAPRALMLRVAPLWYQTVWWKILVGLGAIGLIAALVQGRTAYLRRHRNKLQGLVEEQTAELRTIQKQLEQLAYADPLTSLPNRRLFNDELQSRVALAVRNGNPFALLLIDLDRFKEVNDTIGHDAGDALLVEVAQRLGTAVRDADRVARLGGDEFAVLLSNVSGHDGIEIVCQRIVDSLALPVQFKAHTLQVSASIGVALCPGHASTANDLYKAADVALYAAKGGGRNTWRWYEGAGERVEEAAKVD
jgi:diguanylate cyclase (GGDEF)-like protein